MVGAAFNSPEKQRNIMAFLRTGFDVQVLADIKSPIAILDIRASTASGAPLLR